MLKKSTDKKCAVCTVSFKPFKTTQKVCSQTCALLWARIQEEKKQKKEFRAETKKRKKAIKTTSEWTKDCQRDFNIYIRERDKDKPCISCDRYDHEIADHLRGGKWDAGHYLSVGSHPELRFETTNVHKQCKQCNRDKSGNQGKYRLNLINRIGLANVEWLEGKHEPKRYRSEELEQMAIAYRARTRALKNNVK